MSGAKLTAGALFDDLLHASSRETMPYAPGRCQTEVNRQTRVAFPSRYMACTELSFIAEMVSLLGEAVVAA